MYNQAQQQLQQAVAEGSAMVIQPKMALDLSRLERDINKVEAVYHLGLADGREALPAVQEFCCFGEKQRAG